MTAQHQFLDSELEAWFHPVILPPEPYAEFVRDLNVSLAELEKQHGVRVPFDQQRPIAVAPHKPK